MIYESFLTCAEPLLGAERAGPGVFEVTRGHQSQILSISAFSTNRHITREPEELQSWKKSAFDSSFTVLLPICPQILSNFNGLASREQKFQK